MEPRLPQTAAIGPPVPAQLTRRPDKFIIYAELGMDPL